MSEVTIDGVLYRPCPSPGELSLVVLDKGFVFVGVLDEKDGALVLREVRNVRKWSTGGIGGLSMGARSSGAELDRHEDIEFRPERLVYVSRLSHEWERL